MGKIFYIMGKSSSGKDTIFKLIKQQLPQLETMTLYTTRPIRQGERNGVEYYFVDEDQLCQYKREGKLIESRDYHTIHGIWSYFTVDDGQIDLDRDSYLAIGTLESYELVREYYGTSQVVPIYIEVDDGMRLQRALDRERGQEQPKYVELCRRFLADDVDFSQANLERMQIEKHYINEKLEDCVAEIVLGIQQKI